MQKNNDWNYKMAKYFLDNSRITFLAFAVLLILGVTSGLLLKTIGFPSPDIGIVLVNTTYPGASSDTVLKDVTKPIETAVKGVEGIENFTSTSTNSFSIVSATIKAGLNNDTVKNKISTAVNSLTLPSNATSVISSPLIGGVDFVMSIQDEDSTKVFEAYNEAKTIIERQPEVKSVTSSNEITERLIVTLDKALMASKGTDVSSVQAAIKSLGESFPVTTSLNIDDKKTSLVTSYDKPQNIDSIKLLSLQTRAGLINLQDVATFNLTYQFKNPVFTMVGQNNEGKKYTDKAMAFNINLNENVDSNKFLKTIEEGFRSNNKISYYNNRAGAARLYKNYSVDFENKEQVDEVISGLIGGPLGISNKTLAQVGWLLGGIQLVFLAMVAFVSWRAAIVAALSIPLSLIFTTVYLYFTGESLNTLVLFSLVLVIGLVVDPALVILESIQRKLDAGLKGKEAALAAISDVGGGLFMASVTNIIVFAPFGLISGILGQIFAYIPLTIVPATIGSYIVPLVFLSWLSSIFLKKNKNIVLNELPANATVKEIEDELGRNEINNLWPVAKWLIGVNRKILNGKWFIRYGIIFLTAMIAIGVTGIYFSRGYIKQVQFSSPQNPPNLTLGITHKNDTTDTVRNTLNKEIVSKVMENSDVLEIYPFAQGNVIKLKEAIERESNSTELATKLNTKLNDAYADKLLAVSVKTLSNGPDSSDYQVQVTIKEDDTEKLKKAALAVSAITSKLCDNDGTVSIEDNCKGKKVVVTKIDDGYTNKSNEVEYIEFDRTKLQAKGLLLPTAQAGQIPSLFFATNQIKSIFTIDDGKKQNTVINEGREVPVILESTGDVPTNLESVLNTTLISTTGQPVRLGDVATLVKKTPPASIIRIKGVTQGVVKLGLESSRTDQQNAGKVTNAIVKYYSDKSKTEALSLANNSIVSYSEGGVASFLKSFQELILALVFAIIATYFVLAVFFKSLLQPLAILYTIPLTFTGIFPALAHIGNGQFGFLEIIGLIILVGIVENGAIFLIDSANQIMERDNVDDKEAIALASGLRLRPVLLTKLTAIASLAPLAALSETYRPISLVIIFGLLASGFLSLITTPILFIFFRRVSSKLRGLFKPRTPKVKIVQDSVAKVINIK